MVLRAGGVRTAEREGGGVTGLPREYGIREANEGRVGGAAAIMAVAVAVAQA